MGALGSARGNVGGHTAGAWGRAAAPATLAPARLAAPRRRRGARPAATRPPAKAAAADEGGGSVLGATLLVAGTAVGAGILALPAVTQDCGFVASAAALTGGAAYSIATGLLLAELYVGSVQSGGAAGGAGGSGSAVFAAIARSTLGDAGLAAGAGAYVFLHLALLVAYMSKAAEIIGAASGLAPLPAAAAFAAAFGGLCFAASERLLDRVNGGLVVAVLLAFFGLLASAAPGVEPEALLRADWGAVPATLPVVALSFVYHNVVPVICRSLRGDPAKIRAAIVSGVAVPLLMFVAWDGAILGSLDALAGGGGDAAGGAERLAAGQPASGGGTAPAPALAEAAAAAAPGARARPVRVEDPLAALSAADPSVSLGVGAFSFLAVATSFIGFVLGLTDFIAGALQLPSRRSPLAYLLTLAPPLALAVSFPGIFLGAIDTAGTYGVLTLFGILPVAMAWSARYGGGGGDSDSSGGGKGGSGRRKAGGRGGKAGGGGSRGGVPGGARGGAAAPELVPGGRPVLLLIAGGAAAVIANEVAEKVARLL